MSKVDERRISSILAEALNLSFEDNNFILDDWGKVDNWAKMSTDTYLFLEVEVGQKHPNTNVLKLWPYLEEHDQVRIFFNSGIFANKSRSK